MIIPKKKRKKNRKLQNLKLSVEKRRTQSSPTAERKRCNSGWSSRPALDITWYRVGMFVNNWCGDAHLLPDANETRKHQTAPCAGGESHANSRGVYVIVIVISTRLPEGFPPWGSRSAMRHSGSPYRQHTIRPGCGSIIGLT